jgi:Tol biopolymer transport system component
MLEIGQNISHYNIVEKIGKGGMGEVFRAKDQKLGRDVAIKVLPEEFAKDADRVARFQREAKLLASLNHPNIAAIHGLEESGGTNFLVLELVEGETLADQLKRGPIAVEESLKLALQIAEALEAAHEKGVIHRDLKPANIKVTPDGKLKVLDFGLAKAFAGERGEMILSDSPTLSITATEKGVILGTAAYMSPEQARGETVDKRADVWAFGVVLFEMLTGRATFEGRSVSDVLASVLKSEPEWNRLPPSLHPRIRFLLERCLKKQSKNRYGSISDARVDIQEVLTGLSGVIAQPVAVAEPRASVRKMVTWAAVTLVLIFIVGAVVWSLRPTELRPVMRFEYELPEDQEFGDLLPPILAVSPDGTQFVYSTSEGLYLRSVDKFEAKLIGGTDENPVSPFFSPDGQWIGYFSYPKLKKIAIGGGAPVALCDGPAFPTGASWGVNDVIVFGTPAGIMSVSANGGAAELLIKAKQGEQVHGPQVLPGGEWLLFISASTSGPTRRWDKAQIVVQSLESGERKELIPGDAAKYLPTGHIVYAVGNNLLAVPFDLDSLKVLGGGVPLVEGVLLNANDNLMHYAISNSGTLVYLPETSSGGEGGRTLVWVDRDGQEELLKAPTNRYAFPKISPDEKQVALTIIGGNDDIYTWDLVRKSLTRITFDDGSDRIPLWTPDGKRIVFYSTRERTPGGIYWKAANGVGEAEQIASDPNRMLIPYSWSSDGNTLVMQEAYQEVDTGITKIDVGILSMEGDRTHKPLLQKDSIESHPAVSPDGRWIAYCSDESGQAEIYVRPFPKVNEGKWQISTGGGNSPLWSPDGRELFYLVGRETTEAAMRVAVETEPTFKCGTPEVLFRGTYVGFYPADFPWDIHPDGTRFLMMKEAKEGTRKISIVVNWFDELKQRVPVE